MIASVFISLHRRNDIQHPVAIGSSHVLLRGHRPVIINIIDMHHVRHVDLAHLTLFRSFLLANSQNVASHVLVFFAKANQEEDENSNDSGNDQEGSDEEDLLRRRHSIRSDRLCSIDLNCVCDKFLNLGHLF